MKKHVAIFMVAVSVDPIPGAMDDEHIESDLQRILDNAISHYNPVVIRQRDKEI